MTTDKDGKEGSYELQHAVGRYRPAGPVEKSKVIVVLSDWNLTISIQFKWTSMYTSYTNFVKLDCNLYYLIVPGGTV